MDQFQHAAWREIERLLRQEGLAVGGVLHEQMAELAAGFINIADLFTWCGPRQAARLAYGLVFHLTTGPAERERCAPKSVDVRRYDPERKRGRELAG